MKRHENGRWFNEVNGISSGEDKLLYMCQTDYNHHLGIDHYGVKIYSSEESLRKHEECIKECGIVAVKVKKVEVIQEADYSKYNKSLK